MYKGKLIGLLLVLTIVLSACNQESTPVTANENEVLKVTELTALDDHFNNYEGCFILYDENNNELSIYNKEQAETPVSPCSTFKIVNSLIGLETDVISDASHVYEWDGTTFMLKEWNRDHTLRSAIANSVVWYYQKLASDVGEERMQKHLDEVGYGNKDITGGITQFWLESSLEIAPIEQISILRKLYHDQLPFAEEHMAIVRDIIVLEETDSYTFSGKTGSGASGTLGWFVGVVERDDNKYYFVSNIQGDEQAYGFIAKEIAIEILEEMEVLK